jgi:hypothetical protein
MRSLALSLACALAACGTLDPVDAARTPQFTPGRLPAPVLRTLSPFCSKRRRPSRRPPTRSGRPGARAFFKDQRAGGSATS